MTIYGQCCYRLAIDLKDYQLMIALSSEEKEHVRQTRWCLVQSLALVMVHTDNPKNGKDLFRKYCLELFALSDEALFEKIALWTDESEAYTAMLSEYMG